MTAGLIGPLRLRSLFSAHDLIGERVWMKTNNRFSKTNRERGGGGGEGRGGEGGGRGGKEKKEEKEEEEEDEKEEKEEEEEEEVERLTYHI